MALGANKRGQLMFNKTIKEFGAVGDGMTINTKDIQAAIDACAAADGGKVVVDDAGVYDYDLLNVPDVTPEKCFGFTSENEYLKKLWNVALDDIEKSHNTVTEFGVVYSAGAYGKDFNSLVFCRDNAYAGLLSLNLLYPDEMLEAYKAIRKVRERLGWACFKACGCLLEGVEGVENIELPILDFFKKYQKASAINKTDDVVWIWAFYDLLKNNPQFDESEWRWFYDTATKDFEELYMPFYDSSDGLYYGQPTFIDVGGSGYPNGYNKTTQKCRNRCVWVKASSTNSLYYKALCIMSELADRFGDADKVEKWNVMAEKLRGAMLEKLRFDDGSFTYFLDKKGIRQQHRDTLGASFPVLCGVVSGDDAKLALAGYPITQYGTPLIYPFYPRNDYYHNNSMWPFADTFFLLAYEKAFGVDCSAINLQILTNAFREGHFRELRDVRTNVAIGSYAQLWTTAAFINTVIRCGYTEFSDKKIVY